MLTAKNFKAIVSGERHGLGAILLRAGLRIAEVPYKFAVAVRNRRYDRGQAETHRVEVPVICVGNLTLGGTGKTPMVHFVAKWLRVQGLRVAIISRGYGAEGDQQNDEARELHARLPDVPHIQNPDRVAACRLAIDELEMEVIVMDDGFQHRRLERDLDIVLIDALEPFGFNHVFPRGTLREPMSGLSRAQVVVLSRADLVSESRRGEIQSRVQTLAPNAAWVEVSHQPTELAGTASASTMDIASLKGKRVLAFCGLGNPDGFRRTVESCGADLADFREFPDHHTYSRDDIESLRTWVGERQPELVVCTHKDFVKIETDELAKVPLRALMVELSISVGEVALLRALGQHALDGR